MPVASMLKATWTRKGLLACFYIHVFIHMGVSREPVVKCVLFPPMQVASFGICGPVWSVTIHWFSH